MVLKKIILLTIILGYFCCSCGGGMEKPEGYPDYSTPEKAFWTEEYAVRTGDYYVRWDSLSEDYKKKYGETKEEQLKYFRKLRWKRKIHRNAITRVEDIEYVEGKDYDVILTWSRKSGGKYDILKSYSFLKNFDGKWKVVFPKEYE